MKKKHRERPLRTLFTLLLFILLAVLCIGGVELAVCRVADPPLYETIVAPARQVWANVREIAGEVVQDAQTRIRELDAAVDAEMQAFKERLAATPEPEPEPEELSSQLAGAPAIRQPLTLADPEITQMLEEDGQEYLTGGNVKLRYYNQADDRWRNERFGADPIGSHGCGPTAMAMVVSSMTETLVNPAEMAAWAGDAGYSSPGHGSYLSLIGAAAERYGLRCTPLAELTADTLIEQLSIGGVAVALMGPGHFTRGGHFILLHGVTLSGEILVADPYHRDFCLTTWDPQLIVDELSFNHSDGGPLWMITQ